MIIIYIRSSKLSYLFLLIISLFVFSISELNAQISGTGNDALIQVAARPVKDSIMIRWAPVNYATWDKGNQYGYKVLRYTILRDSLLVEKAEITDLTPTVLKPLPLANWEPLVKRNKYCAITAQAIYGQTFVVDAGKNFNPEKVYSISEEQKQRFSFALYAADLSTEAAKAAGLFFSDASAKANEKYLYRVILNMPQKLRAKGDTGYVYTGLSMYKPLPQPVEFKVEFEDKIAAISWNAYAQNNVYIGYYLEKSLDGGKTFQSVNEDPIAYMITDAAVNPEYMYKFDTLPENGKQYFYRMRGVTSFGEVGPYSKNLSGKGMRLLAAAPNIIKYVMVENKVKIYWEFPKESEKEIKGFKVFRSDNHRDGYKLLTSAITPVTRAYTDNLPLGTGYYKIVAWQDSSRFRESYPYLVQLTDSIPPAAPVGLTGKVDTTYIVKLKWIPNTEKDIYGYRVFRSVSGKDEYSQLTHFPVSNAVYSDTLNKSDLNSTIYYKILAVDQRQNESMFSKILEIVKPDLIPPAAPVLKMVKALPDGIRLEWVNSNSKDVENHLLYRKYRNDTLWQVISEFPSKKNQETPAFFIDIEIEAGKSAIYKIEARDKSGNYSKSSVSIEISSLKSVLAMGVTKIQKTVDDENGRITINWELPKNKVKNYLIYRKTSDVDYSIYETVQGDKNFFEDYGLKAGNKYTYRIKVIYQDNSVSGFSEEIVCNF